MNSVSYARSVRCMHKGAPRPADAKIGRIDYTARSTSHGQHKQCSIMISDLIWGTIRKNSTRPPITRHIAGQAESTAAAAAAAASAVKVSAARAARAAETGEGIGCSSRHRLRQRREEWRDGGAASPRTRVSAHARTVDQARQHIKLWVNMVQQGTHRDGQHGRRHEKASCWQRVACGEARSGEVGWDITRTLANHHRSACDAQGGRTRSRAAPRWLAGRRWRVLGGGLGGGGRRERGVAHIRDRGLDRPEGLDLQSGPIVRSWRRGTRPKAGEERAHSGSALSCSPKSSGGAFHSTRSIPLCGV